jgi:hypothetical protein
VRHLTLLNHVIISLACAAAGWFAYKAGVLQSVWANDASGMTGVLAIMFILTTAYIGRLAWSVSPQTDTYALHILIPMAGMAGFAGTSVGLMILFRTQVSGAAALGGLATCLSTAAGGVLTMLALSAMWLNLESGVRR